MSNDEEYNQPSRSQFGALELLNVSDSERKLLKCLLQHPNCCLGDLSGHLEESPEIIGELVDSLMIKGMINSCQENEMTVYCARLETKPKRRQLPQKIWQTLDDL